MAATNYSIYAIPACWLLALFPHMYAMQSVKNANNGRWNNVNPRSAAWGESIQKSVPANVLATYERSEAAHKNGMENLPLFISAIILGNLAKLPASTLNGAAAAYLGLRVAYTYAYINTTNEKASFARTGIWATSLGTLMYLFVASGNVLAKGYA